MNDGRQMIAALSQPEEHIDFDSAAMFLEQAKTAHRTGDEKSCLAARKLVAIALGLTDGPVVRIHTGHLKS